MHLPTKPIRFNRPKVAHTATWGLRQRQMQRDPRMRRLAHGIWARWEHEPAPQDLEPWEISALIQPLVGPGASVCDMSAAHVLQLPMMAGMAWVDDLLGESNTYTPWPQIPEIALPADRKTKPLTGVHLRRRRPWLPDQPGPWRTRVTGPVETLLVTQQWLRGWRATAAVDHVLARVLGPDGFPAPMAPEDLLSQVTGIPPGTRGKRLLSRAVVESAGNVWSPMETVLRLVVLRWGFPLPAHNHQVVLGGGRSVYLDLAWPHRRVAIEYNGAVHYQDRVTYADEMGRLNALRDAGWEVRVVVLEDLRDPVRRHALFNWLRAHL